ncbi:MAG TPA: type II toxin-antitoxin system RelE/ParE family toxin [Aestuariivirga sp.]|jgi:toxin ParE1/3/4|nr:type II toxin-antitoxin system RelE/ParE family toxin [Aestuariivirga sp.]
MNQLRLGPKARTDLAAIWDYTALHWDDEQADAYVVSLGETMKLLANQPSLGRKIGDIREGYFKFPAASHIFIYRTRPNIVEVIRILHKSMDVEGHL